MKITEMEVTNMGMVGSLEPAERLLDSYSNNSEDREKLIISQLTSNPFDIKLPESSNTLGNDNMMLNAYLNSMGLDFETGFKQYDIDKINKDLTDEDIILLGSVLEIYNVQDKEFDMSDFVKDMDKYTEEVEEFYKED